LAQTDRFWRWMERDTLSIDKQRNRRLSRMLSSAGDNILKESLITFVAPQILMFESFDAIVLFVVQIEELEFLT
jgi:hypothetical protein